MAEVFISYARATEPQAQMVEQALKAAGYAVWRDNALPVHRAYAQVIEERIDKARAVVVLWSRDAAKSEWVRSEANRARELGKLIQVSLDRTLPPMPFDQLHCADLEGWRGAADDDWAKVLESLAALAEAPTPALLASNHTLPKAKAGSQPLLAVLAFDNLSGDADFLYFSDGISDEILHAVAHTTGLKVIARSSSFQLRGPEKSADSVAQRLAATHLLDGSVRRSGDRVRITAQLVECASQTTLWSDRFDRDLSDVFALQDEIAQAVAQALKSAFAPRETTAVDPAAYDLYLRARELDPSRFGFDIALLEEALARAPDFLPAWESLAISYAVNARYSQPEPAKFEELTAKMDAALERVAALDPGSVMPSMVRAMVAPLCGAFLETERSLARVLAARPTDPSALSMCSGQALAVGRSRVALAYASQAFELDPLQPITAGLYGEMLGQNGRFREAFAVLDDAVARWPENGFVRTTAMGKAIEAKDWARLDRYANTPGDLGLYGPWLQVLVQTGEEMKAWTAEDSARTLATERAVLEATGSILLSPLGYLCGYGCAEEVFELVEKASFAHLFQASGRLLPGDVAITHIYLPIAKPLRDDPRFLRLCAKLGLVDYWLQTDRWPDCADQVPYDFRAQARALADARPEPAE
jgi:TolB-like protein